MVDQVADHAVDQRPGRREIDADIGVSLLRKNGRDEADQTALSIDQGAARSTRIDGGVGLDEILDFVEPRIGPPGRRNHAAGHGQPPPERIADGADRLGQGRVRSRRGRGEIGLDL